MVRRLFDYVTEASAVFPDKKALYDQERSYTYGQLEKITNQFANFLISLDIKRGDRVAVFFDEKDTTYIVSMLAIMKVGAIYVPINNKLATPQIDKIIKDCTPSLIICNNIQINLPKKVKVLYIDYNLTREQIINDVTTIINLSFLEKFSSEKPDTNVLGLDIAYILYTSGSTGIPKGVMISHSNILSVIEWRKEALGFNNNTKLMSLAPMYFDTNILEVYCTLSKMGELYIFDASKYSVKKIIKDIINDKITKFICVPTIALMLLELKEKLLKHDLSYVDTIVVSGGAISVINIKSLSNVFTNANFFNGFGLTETSVSATLFKIGNSKTINCEAMPLGRTMANGEFYVLDENDIQVKYDEVGELVVRGPNIMQGYWKNKKATDKVLKKNPVFPHLSDKVLYTGDLVRLDKSGDIFFVGRKDDQIKTSGYRVELGEVERILSDMEFINECCVVASDDKQLGKKICCYLVLRDKELKVEDLIKKCSEKMPHYMVPHSWTLMDELPKLANDKIDRSSIKKLANI